MNKLVKCYEATAHKPLPKIATSDDADATFEQVKGALDRISAKTEKNRTRRTSQLKISSIYNSFGGPPRQALIIWIVVIDT